MKTKKIIIAVTLCICVSTGMVFAYSAMQKVQGADEFNSVGVETKSAVETLLANEKKWKKMVQDHRYLEMIQKQS